MKNLLFILLVCFPFFLKGQGNCEGSFKPYYLNSNHIRASFFPRGNKFTSGDGRPGFLVPFPSEQRLSTIFGSSIWIGGFDDAGNLEEATETYQPGGKIDFSVGPLNSIGLPFDSICNHFDQAWSVYSEDIQAHRLDFMEDYKIDDTLPSIFGWPGRGNKHFKKYYGFELPNDNQGLAPFWDWNGNTIYDPENGDYPCIKFSQFGEPVIPDQILWMVFNDVDPHDSTYETRPLRFEFQLTVFAFHCEDNEILNNTIFNQYKIISRAVLVLDSVFFGCWTDYDLGCPEDDYIGSDSLRNTEFVYNGDPVDGYQDIYCFEGNVAYARHPPIQSMTYLNYPMHSFIEAHSLIDEGIKRYRLLNGQWENGAPIRPIGNGQVFNDTLSPTHFLFSGDPRDSLSWAANHVFENGYDVRTVSSVSLGRMDPGSIKTILTAYQFHSDTSLGYLDHITLMKENIDSLKSFFNHPVFPCTPFAPCSSMDCVWPGDFDHNNIADYRDLLMWGVFNDLSGPERDGLVSWRGHYSEDWNKDVLGINAKHTDGDGNGNIDLADLKINEDHFRFTNRFYQKQDLFPEGPEIVLTSNPMESNGQIRSLRVRAGIDLQNILGLAFELDYDTSLYEIHQIRIRNCPADSNIVCFGTNDYSPDDPGVIVSPEYAFVMTNHQPLSIPAGYIFDRLASGLRLKPNITLQDLPDTVIIRVKNLIGIDPNGYDLYLGSNTLKIPNYLITGTADPGTNDPSVLIYPNPANQSIAVETESNTDILIFNLQGQVVKKIPASGIDLPIDISSLSPGLYILQIVETGQPYKFIKQ